jgi:hypothetical protein
VAERVTTGPLRAAANQEQKGNFMLDDESPMSDVSGAGRHPGRVVFDIVHRKE